MISIFLPRPPPRTRGSPELSGRKAPPLDLEGNALGPAWDIGAYRVGLAPLTAR